VKLLALDYGRARTGVAVSDPSGTLARPLTVVERVGSPAGMAALLAIVADEAPDRIVVGLPRTPSGERGAQAEATLAFVGRLRREITVPIELEDERYTTSIARANQPTGSRKRPAKRTGTDTSRSSGRGGRSDPVDAQAAAVLLQGVLDARGGGSSSAPSG
jgi:putative Holliday junction resolvase